MHTYTGYQTVVPAKRAVVVGGGFIGLEMAENLIHLGLTVTLVQRDNQLMPPLDIEMAHYVKNHMEKNGVHVVLEDGATAFKQSENGALKSLRNLAKHLRPTSLCWAIETVLICINKDI